MVMKLLVPWLLMAICVVIHAIGIMGALRWIERSTALSVTRFWPLTLFLVWVAGWLIVLHLLEIAVWGAFYIWQQLMPHLNDAFYFSAVTYTTTGYGDVVLPAGWPMLEASKRSQASSCAACPRDFSSLW